MGSERIISLSLLLLEAAKNCHNKVGYAQAKQGKYRRGAAAKTEST
jgi:hypothetical protein